jgi:hypothetical protein
VSLHVNPVGEPDAGKPHVRFDERGPETEWLSTTAPVLDSTQQSAVTQDPADFCSGKLGRRSSMVCRDYDYVGLGRFP